VEGHVIEAAMTEESYISNRGRVVNELDVMALVIKDAAGGDVTSNYMIETKSGWLILR
jgi:hypothetical protein